MTSRIRVFGIVQGVGFRPTVSRHAAAAGITGSVCNCGPYVEIIAQGSEEKVELFLSLLKEKPPKRASIIRMDREELGEAKEYASFEIIESAKTKGAIFISPDIALCEDCRREMFDPKNKRYHHPFINCTCCGPRLTILDALPYDRERTSMKEFPMCDYCAAEYYDPATRRYDAQPVCCPDCGPVVYVLGMEDGRRQESGLRAITKAREVISRGGIVAIKGIGGFHLCCDATKDAAVMLLRERKNRPMKPFAVMLRDEMTAKRECLYTDTEREILTGHQKPILLLPKKPGGKLSRYIAPDNGKVGVMLPYAPVQELLFRLDDGIEMPDALVMTSGNISGAPIAHNDEEALEQLAHLTDLILSNDRKIRIRADDSVMDFYRDKPYMVRRSRGYAPLPQLIALPEEAKDLQILAVGGELKNTFCISRGDLFYPSSYIGDLKDPRSMEALEETIVRYQTLLEVTPQAVVADLHPGYHSGEAAQRITKEQDIPLLKVQHHYAHIVSCLAEHDYREKVIGVALDGTGWGTDETIWGGEILLADYFGFERVGSIDPFVMVGGDAASREGWRVAVSMLGDKAWRAADEEGRERILKRLEELKLCTASEARVLLTMGERKINAVTSTSCGRLFDAVSAVLGIRRSSTFEGEAAMALEDMAKRYIRESTSLEAALETAEGKADFGDALREEEGRLLLPTEQLIDHLANRVLCGEKADYLAFVFHLSLAKYIAGAVRKIADRSGITTCALSGGCYQNTLLTELSERLLHEEGLQVLVHSLIPPNDGGIALGQAVVGAMRIAGRQSGQYENR